MLFLSNPPGIDKDVQKDSLDTINALNKKRLDVMGDPEITARISAYEMAGRMQASAPGANGSLEGDEGNARDVRRGTGQAEFRERLLAARRLIERGVRFVQIFHEAWDHHSGLTNGLKSECGKTDKASAALIKDLKQRGLLKDTLVIWGGEFGRTPMVQGSSDGRDHHPNCYTIWMAGGGVKPGTVLGTSDDFGFNVVEDKVHVHDLNATILHLLGVDHTEAHVPIARPRFPTHRRPRQCREEALGMTEFFHHKDTKIARRAQRRQKLNLAVSPLLLSLWPLCLLCVFVVKLFLFDSTSQPQRSAGQFRAIRRVVRGAGGPICGVDGQKRLRQNHHS